MTENLDNGGCVTFKQFLGRLFFKLSSLKILSYILAVIALLFLVKFIQWKPDVDQELYLRAFDVLQTITISILVVRGTQNIVGDITKYFTKKNGGAK